MRIGQWSDLHHTTKEADAYMHKIWSVIDEQITVHKLDTVILSGDLATAKDCHPGILVNQITDGIRSLAKRVPVTIIPGNHDGISEDLTYWEFLKHVPGVKYIKTPTRVELQATVLCGSLPVHTFSDEPGLGIWHLPFSRNPLKEWEGLDFTNSLVFTHVTVRGVTAETGQILDSPVGAEIFDKSIAAFSGDIHLPQEIGKLVYVGSPYPIRFSDRFKGGFIIIDTDKVGTDEICWQRYEHDCFPCRHTFDVADLSDFQNKALIVAPGDQLKVRIHLTRDTMYSFREIQESIKKHAHDNLQVSTIMVSRIIDDQREPEQTKSYSKTSTVLNLDDFCRRHNISDASKEIGKQILAEAL